MDLDLLPGLGCQDDPAMALGGRVLLFSSESSFAGGDTCSLVSRGDHVILRQQPVFMWKSSQMYTDMEPQAGCMSALDV